MIPKVRWPMGKDFAFTIFDDPDLDTAESTATIYSFLTDLGLQTTKAVWPLEGNAPSRFGGATCANADYLKLILNLREKGFEVAFHNASHQTSPRGRTAEGLEVFQRLFGHPPTSMANHSGCHECIYWGSARVSGAYRIIYKTLNLMLKRTDPVVSQGHVDGSPLFWGDLCREKIKYVRNFVFGDINTLKACPMMPYHDPIRPFVNYWFAASEGANVKSFNATMHEKNQDKLASEGGACIMYTHLANGFLDKEKIDGRFKTLMERISKLNGWFVPVSTLLDFILHSRGNHIITHSERSELERRWIQHKIVGTRGRS